MKYFSLSILFVFFSGVIVAPTVLAITTQDQCNDQVVDACPECNVDYSMFPDQLDQVDLDQVAHRELTEADMSETYRVQRYVDNRTALSESTRPPLNVELLVHIGPQPLEQIEAGQDGLGYTPVWVNPSNNPGYLTVSTGAMPGNHLSTQGLLWVSEGVLYLAWESFDEGADTKSVLFTRLVGSERYGFKGTTFDVLFAHGPGNQIDDIKMVRAANDSVWVTWLLSAGSYRGVYAALWNGTCWGTHNTCYPIDLTWPYGQWVYGYDVALNPLTGRPSVAWVDNYNRVVYRELAADGRWSGHAAGSWGEVLFADPSRSVYTQLYGVELLFRPTGKPNVIFTGHYGANPTNVRVRYWDNGWRAYYGQATNVLPVKASVLISACFDKLYGRLYIAGQWEMSGGPPMDWFVLQGPAKFQAINGGNWDWVSAWRGYWPVVDSDSTSRPFVVFMDPNSPPYGQETVLARWNATWFGGYGSNPNNRAPTRVSTDTFGQWAASFSKDPSDKAHVAYTTCTAISPACATSQVRYTRER